jgi:cytochrome P450
MTGAWTDVGRVSLRTVVRGDRIGMLEEARARGGDYAVARVARMPIHLVSDPEGIRHVLVKNQRNYVRGEPEGSPLARSLGRGVLLADGDDHRRQRRLLQPAFHPTRVAEYAGVVSDVVEGVAKDWHAHEGSVVDIHEQMMRLAMVAIGRVLFDVDVAGEARELGEALASMNALCVDLGFSWTGWLPWIPTRGNRHLARATRAIDETLYRIIGERRRSGLDKGDVLSMLIAARDEAPGSDDPAGGMTDRQVRDEALVLFAAGHETTANMLSWTWWLLARHREVEERLHEELDAVLGGRPPRVADLPTLPYTDRVLRESLRLLPPVWVNTRRSLEADEVEGHPLPAKAIVFLAPWVVHRDPRWWPDPLRFDPDRFVPGAGEERPRFAYFPFGGGVRQCIGQLFAEMEGRLVLAGLAQRFSPRLLPGHRVEPEPMITLRPKGGLPMRLMPRH